MFKNTVIIIEVVILGAVTFSYFYLPDKSTDAPEKYVSITDINFKEKIISINEKRLEIAIADNPQEQSGGLSGVAKITNKQGMLFIFPQPLLPSFWMKNMRFALDIIWIDADSKIVSISKNISPATFPKTFSPPFPVLYVLEVNSGWSDRNNIKVGDNISF